MKTETLLQLNRAALASPLLGTDTKVRFYGFIKRRLKESGFKGE
jgi:hypothetical protein